MRLTNKNYDNDVLEIQKTRKVVRPDGGLGNYSQWDYNNDLWNYVKVREDIEEELGIELLTLITALKNGIYVKNRRNEIRRVSCNIGLVETGGHNSLGLRFQDTNYKWRYLVLDTSRDNDIKDYGKTWAFTKEELL